MGPFDGLTAAQRFQIREAHAAAKIARANKVPASRGKCSSCGREFNLTKQGKVRHHGAKSDAWPPVNCVGSGKAPKSEEN